MRINFLIILFGSILLSCNNDKDNNTVKEDFCDCEMLAHDNLFNHFYLEDRKKPYTGVCKSFYQNGQIKQERELANGKNNGFFRNYSESGILLEEGAFLDNRHHGWFKYYDEQGELIIEVEYNNGVPVTERAQE
jgi:antitoxin component YwqK of YwqJK toxin-antitoxin module